MPATMTPKQFAAPKPRTMTPEEFSAPKAMTPEEFAAPTPTMSLEDATERTKGPGFLGTLQRPDGGVSTELSVGVGIDGVETEIPSLVPTLTEAEIKHLLGGGKPTQAIVRKAVSHAKDRNRLGKSPFAEAAPPSEVESAGLQGTSFRSGVTTKEAGAKPTPGILGVTAKPMVYGGAGTGEALARGAEREIKVWHQRIWPVLAYPAEKLRTLVRGQPTPSIAEARETVRQSPMMTEPGPYSDLADVLGRFQEEHPDWAPRQIESAGQLLSDPNALISNLAAMIPYMATTTAAFLAAGPGAAGLVAYGVESQGAYENAIAFGASEEDAQTAAAITGTVNAIIELAQVGAWVKFGKKTAKAVLIREAARRAIAKTTAGQAAVLALREGVEEVLQGATEDVTARVVYGKPFEDFWKNRQVEAVLGGLGGLAMGGGGVAVSVVAAKAQAQMQTVADLGTPTAPAVVPAEPVPVRPEDIPPAEPVPVRPEDIPPAAPVVTPEQPAVETKPKRPRGPERIEQERVDRAVEDIDREGLPAEAEEKAVTRKKTTGIGVAKQVERKQPLEEALALYEKAKKNAYKVGPKYQSRQEHLVREQLANDLRPRVEAGEEVPAKYLKMFKERFWAQKALVKMGEDISPWRISPEGEAPAQPTEGKQPAPRMIRKFEGPKQARRYKPQANLDRALRVAYDTATEQSRFVYAGHGGFLLADKPPVNQAHFEVTPTGEVYTHPYAPGVAGVAETMEAEHKAGRRRVLENRIRQGKPVPLSVLREYAGQKWADDAIAAQKIELPKYEKKPGLAKQLAEEETGSMAVGGIQEVAGAIGRGTKETAQETYAAARKAVTAARGSYAAVAKPLGRAWRTVLSLPARIVKQIPGENPIGRLRDVIGRGFSDEYGRPKTWVARKRRAKGASRDARILADEIGRKYTKTLKAAGVDPEAPETHIAIEMALRGKLDVEQLPEAAQAWALSARAALDVESKAAAEIFRKAGMESRAEVYDQNVGAYLKNVPIASVSSTEKIKSFIGRLMGPRLSRSWGKFKRDKWIVRVDGRIRKFETQEEAKTAYVEAVNAKKAKLFSKRGQAKEWTLTREGFVPTKEGGKLHWEKTEAGVGMEPSDLYRQAARRVELIEPISEAWRLEHEVHDPRYLVARSIIETRHDAEMVQLFSKAAKKWGQKAPKGTQPEIDAWAKENDLAPLPQTGRLHDLAGMYVPKTIAEDLTEMTRMPGTAQKMFRAYMHAWKSSKTIYNPATHARNVMGNFMFAYLARTSPLNPGNGKHYVSSVKSLLKKDADYHFLVRQGVLGAEFFGAELHRLEVGLRGVEPGRIGDVIAGLKAIHNKVGDLYAAEDQVFKMAAFKKYRAEGTSAKRAAAEVDKWFPNYERVGRITRWLRQVPYGAPFASFMDQSIRIGARGVRDRPLRMAAMVSLPGIVTYLSVWALGMSPEEKELLDEERGYFEPILPFRDKWGRVQTLDLRYIVPLANDVIPELRGSNIRVPWFASGPVATAAIEQTTGQDLFTGRKIVKAGMTGKEQAIARGKQAVKTLAPYPSGVWWGPKRIGGAISGDRKESVANAILGTILGVNIRSPYVAEKRVRDIGKRMIADGEEGQAKALLKLWNERYKPDYRPEVSIKSLKIGTKISRTAKRNKARDEAAEAILQGKEAEAKEIIAEYRKEYPQGRELYLDMAQDRADVFKEQGKTR